MIAKGIKDILEEETKSEKLIEEKTHTTEKLVAQKKKAIDDELKKEKIIEKNKKETNMLDKKTEKKIASAAHLFVKNFKFE
ncbi:MAG: hypothetical protein KAT91_04515 [Candidatus Aenigmarchaeota archaeon]|nr:hypothetical protein [Candidatus Aenigmarchaeota archaeon]